MRPNLHVALTFLTLGCAAFAAEPGFNSLFNGKDLTGWDGNPKLWSVKDGAITGQTTKENPTKGNTFLIWKGGPVEDFELRFSYKIVPNNTSGFANSGVQYRSKVLNPANWVVGGYQADFEAGTTYSGILYDEASGAGGRGIMAQRGEKVVWGTDCKKQVAGSVGNSADIQAKIKKEDWNDYVVIAKGNHLVHQINGATTVDVTDDCESKRLKSGVLALQLHAGDPMTVQFKDVRIKPLSGATTTKSDLDLVQGDWIAAEMNANGNRLDADALSKIKLNIKGNDYSFESDNGQGTGSFKLNTTTNPKSMDVTTSDGADLPAIYEVTADMMKVCYAVNGASRPTDFTATEGSDRVSVLYKHKPK
jgi:uncharacterized protein (TIGR03067 family)